MVDAFDAFLKDVLAPRVGDADRAFVAKVQAHIALEERLAGERRSLVAKLVKELVGLLAIAGALALLSRSPVITEFAAGAPAIAIAILLVAFWFVVTIFSSVTAPRALA